uniref:Pyruvate kinase n=1 Tax=Pyropia yezoensis TaxID=2788 RepID=A0A097IU90_PYRYE|nr:pyruvate kinase [Neopyropia yezoensis]
MQTIIPTGTGDQYTLENILNNQGYEDKHTKVVCTIGPACNNVETLTKMIDYGMNIARLNFSHGDHESHKQTVKNLREAFRKRKNKPVAILLDTKGPEIRSGFFAEGKTITLTQGQDLILTTDYTFKGDNTKIACSYPALATSVKVGQQILVADGSLVLEVKSLLEDGVVTTVTNNATIGERKNMNLPGVEIKLPTITEKDEHDIVDFGLKNGVDMVALSFARTAGDIEECRDLLGPKGSNIKIIAKIENQEGLNNYDAIVDASDGIMVARGDLGMEIPSQKVFVAQKWMIRKANAAGKAVITATQMLESMINNPRPTRAEASDVANAVLDGSDCVMLSGETAGGAHPLKAVEIMSKIAVEAEFCSNSAETFNRLAKLPITCNQEAMAMSATQLSFKLTKCNAIICFTETGLMARLVSKYRPDAYIVAVSIDDKVIKGLSMNRGVMTLKIPSFQGIENIIKYAIKCAIKRGYCAEGEPVVVIRGQNEEKPDQQNLLQIMTAQNFTE